MIIIKVLKILAVLVLSILLANIADAKIGETVRILVLATGATIANNILWSKKTTQNWEAEEPPIQQQPTQGNEGGLFSHSFISIN